MSNDWQNKLRSEFEQYGEKAPEGLWAAVRDSLEPYAAQTAVTPDPDRAALRRRRRRFAGYAAFGSFAVATLVLALVLFPRNDVRQVGQPDALLALGEAPLVQEDAFRDKLVQSEPIPEFSGTPVLIHRDERTDNGSAEVSVALDADDVRYGDTLEQEAGMGGEKEELEGSASVVSESVLPDNDSNPVHTGVHGRQPSETALEFYDADEFFPAGNVSPSENARRQLSLKLALSGSAFTQGNSSGYDAMYGSSVAALRFTAIPVANDGYSAVLLGNNYQDVSTDRRHYQPIDLGVRLNWDFSPRLALSSGIEYSCLISDLSSGTERNYYETRQTLHYIGIPLALEWSFVDRPRFRAYLSAGGQVRKAVYGRSNTRYVVASVVSDTQSERVYERPLQWSAGIGAGVEYMFGDNFGLYAEPGINYYFDNGSPVENVFKTRPMNFNLSVGVRWRL